MCHVTATYTANQCTCHKLLRHHCCRCQQVTGKAGQSSLCVTDPYGIRIALRKGHPLSLLTWQEYLSVIQRAAAACEQLLPGQALQQLMAFSREQRNLVRPLWPMCDWSWEAHCLPGGATCKCHLRRPMVPIVSIGTTNLCL